MKKLLSMLVVAFMIIFGLFFGMGSASATGHGNTKANHPTKQTHTTKPTHPAKLKDYVCKYVGKPGVHERLQTGQNPIWVDTHATQGTWFNDKHGRSFVLIADSPKLNPEPSVTDCPAVSTPTPTVTTPSVTTTTPSSTTTTSSSTTTSPSSTTTSSTTTSSSTTTTGSSTTTTTSTSQPTTTTKTSATETTVPEATTQPVANSLPRTGVNAWIYVGIAFALILSGIVLLYGKRLARRH